MAEIIIGSGKLDGLDDLEIQLTSTLADIRDVLDKGTLFSVNVKIPVTPNNNKLFGYLYDPNVYSDIDVNRKIPIVISINDVTGVECDLQVVETEVNNGKREYVCNILGKNNDLFGSLRNLYLKDIESLSDLSHVYSKNNIQLSWTHTVKDWYYPYIEYGSYWTLEEIQNDDVLDTNSVTSGYTWMPAVRAKFLWDKIWEEAGFTYDSSFFDTNTDFANLFIPYTNSKLRYSSDTVPLLDIGMSWSYSKEWEENQDFSWDVYKWDIIFSDVSTTSNDPLSKWHDNGGASSQSFQDFWYDIPVEGIYTITFTKGTSSYNNNDPSYSGGDTIRYYVKTMVSPYKTLIYTSIDCDIDTEVSTSIDVELLEGDKIYWFGYPQVSIGSDHNDYVQYDTDIKLEIKAKDTELILGYTTINFEDVVPNATQIDFVKSIIKMYNLFFEKDPFSNNYLIEPRDTYYSLGNSYDWSDKFALNKQYKMSYFNDMDIKTYSFKYLTADDYQNVEYTDANNIDFGEKKLEMENDFSKTDKTVELLFSPTINKKVEGSFYWYVPQLTNDEDLGEADFSTEWNPRLLFKVSTDIQGASGETFMYNGTEQTRLYTLCHNNEMFPTDTTFVDINYETSSEPSGLPTSQFNLYNLYWANYVSYINSKDTEVLIGYFDLTYEDFIKLRFKDRFYISDFKCWWILNEISSYIIGTNQLTKLELIKEQVGGANDENTTFYDLTYNGCSSFYDGDSLSVNFYVKNDSDIDHALVQGTLTFGGDTKSYIYNLDPSEIQYITKTFTNISEGNQTLTLSGSYDYTDAITVHPEEDKFSMYYQYIKSEVVQGDSGGAVFVRLIIRNNSCLTSSYPNLTVTLDTGAGGLVTQTLAVGNISSYSHRCFSQFPIPSNATIGSAPVYIDSDVYHYTGSTYIDEYLPV